MGDSDEEHLGESSGLLNSGPRKFAEFTAWRIKKLNGGSR